MLALFPSRTVAVSVLGFPIHWYGILYACGFALAWVLLPRLQRHRGLTWLRGDFEHLLAAGVLGVLLGGRLGFVLLYEPRYFLAHPLEILSVWNGGMASHGGFVGVALALFLVMRGRERDLLKIADIAVVPIALGLALGRLGNFINQELYGIPTALPWGIMIPGVEELRHPTALYAIGKDLLIALVCFAHLRRSGSRVGGTAGLFLLLYGMLRFGLEFLRDQPYGWIDFGVASLTPGQVFTIPLIAAGAALWVYAGRRRGGMSSGASGTGQAG
ncbi:MAG: phosphatidylglycerol:prolipoprotein diacylglycerol transferase [Candidatus Peregrinibacteria bacterium Gr01-1014_25]|nr:MAG: phosphatidylglycerol:prolipoprotein diacylglycerol transferase [Candidatus Peregrinibacteria bacterium Gr01-1014_25]